MIENLAALRDTLLQLGYNANLTEESITVNVGEQFPLVITHSDGEFTFVCQVADLADMQDDDVAKFAVAALDANQRIRPFAFALIVDGDEEQVPVTLIDSIPSTDLDKSEVSNTMLKLQSALINSRSVMEAIEGLVTA